MTAQNLMTNRNQRCEVLAMGDSEAIMAAAEELLAELVPGDLDIVMAPRVATVMLRQREPVADVAFNLGEVIVTEARVVIRGEGGYAIRLGNTLEVTLAAAILDAAATCPEFSAFVDTRLTRCARDTLERERAAWRDIAATRVVFEEMAP